MSKNFTNDGTGYRCKACQLHPLSFLQMLAHECPSANKLRDLEAENAALQARLERIAALIPKEVKVAIAAEGDGLEETLVKLVLHFHLLLEEVQANLSSPTPEDTAQSSG